MELPSHFNVAKTYGVFVTNVARLLSLSGHCDMLDGLPVMCDEQRDFAVCTVMKP